jgi:hypothetical protein
MNVAVLMFHDDPSVDYVRMNRAINEKYCKKFGLHFVFASERKYAERHPAWERLPLLLEHLPNHDYLVWVDSDAFFYHDADVRELVAAHPGPDFLFSRDIRNVRLNTGVLVVKNTPYSAAFLAKWAYDEALYKSNPHPKFWDQGVLIDMYNKDVLGVQGNSRVLDYGVLQHFLAHEFRRRTPRPYVYHLAGRNKEVRAAESKKYFDTLFES